jgi:excisionase family DNA binding protein
MPTPVSNGNWRRTPGGGPVPTDAGELVDFAAASSYLGVSDAFIRRLVLEKRVRYYKVGRFVRFRLADLDAFVAAGAVDPVPLRGRNITYSRRR